MPTFIIITFIVAVFVVIVNNAAVKARFIIIADTIIITSLNAIIKIIVFKFIKESRH
jgi:hypothetical protein